MEAESRRVVGGRGVTPAGMASGSRARSGASVAGVWGRGHGLGERGGGARGWQKMGRGEMNACICGGEEGGGTG